MYHEVLRGDGYLQKGQICIDGHEKARHAASVDIQYRESNRFESSHQPHKIVGKVVPKFSVAVITECIAMLLAQLKLAFNLYSESPDHYC